MFLFQAAQPVLLTVINGSYGAGRTIPSAKAEWPRRADCGPSRPRRGTGRFDPFRPLPQAGSAAIRRDTKRVLLFPHLAPGQRDNGNAAVFKTRLEGKKHMVFGQGQHHPGLRVT
jgi:hypothetical protein